MHQCPQGHPTSPGAAFCSVCGVSVEPEVIILRDSASSRSNQPTRRFRRTALGITALVAILVVATVVIVMVAREENAQVATAPETTSGATSSAVVQDPQELMLTLSPIISGCSLQADDPDGEGRPGAQVSHCAPDLVGIGQPEGYDGDLYIAVYPPEERLTEDAIESMTDLEVTFFGPGESPTEAIEDNHYGVFLDNWLLTYLPREIAEGMHSIFPSAQFFHYS